MDRATDLAGAIERDRDHSEVGAKEVSDGGPAIPVIPVTDRPVSAAPALRVAVVSDGRPVEGGPTRPVYVVTDNRPTQGNTPMPIVLATGAQASHVMAGPAIPVVVVSGSLGGTAPVNTVLPVISGTLAIGQTLTTTDGTWTNSPISYTYQWKRNGANIGGATAPTYALTASDPGTTITVTVTATNASGSASATSAGTVIGFVVSGLQVEYRFDDGSGITLTDYVSGLNGTLQNGPAWTSAGVLFAVASSQYVSRPAVGAAQIHLIGVAMIPNVVTADRSLAGRWGATTGVNRSYLTKIQSTRNLLGAAATAAALAAPTSGNTITVGTWFIWELYFDGANVGVRLNATGAYATSALAGNLFNGGPTALARNEDGPKEYFDGTMGYLLEYNRALSTTEVDQNATVLRARMLARGVTVP
jgi:hypothetical protein